MFGSSRKNNGRDRRQQGLIGADGRRVDTKESGKRVKLKRTDAEIKILNSNPNGDASDESVNAILPARVILNEFSDAGVGVYTTERLRMGQEVALTIDDPRRFYITGKVLYCNEVRSDSKIMQQVNFPWRAGVEFIYKSDAERSEVAAYCEELRQTWLGALVPSVVPGPPKVASAPAAATVEGSTSPSEGQSQADPFAAVDPDGTKEAA